MWQLKFGSQQGKYITGIPSNASTNYIPVSSDAGCLVLASSNTFHGLDGTSDASIGSTNAGGIRFMGIFIKAEYENDKSSCSTFGSTACRLKVQRVLDGDVLEVDYSTASSHSSGTSGDLHTTNIGMFYRYAHSSDSTTATLGTAVGQYLNVTTGANVLGTSRGMVFRLESYSTIDKKATVTYFDPMFTS